MARLSASALLSRLDRWKDRYEPEATRRKVEALAGLERRRLTRSGDVLRLHEALCFLRAYPDDAEVLERVARMLDGFDRRGDLRRHREALADTGINGTAIHFSFFWFTAMWLAHNWPDRLKIDWEDFEHEDDLVDLLPRLLPFSETPGLDMEDLTSRQWIERLRGRDETDATFVIRRFESLRTDEFGQEATYEGLDVPIRLETGENSPSRTRAWIPRRRIFYQTGPLNRARPALTEAIERPPVAIRDLSVREGRRLIDRIREAMVTRHRDLYSFSHADPEDARIIDCGGGLEFACVGTVAERRLMLESVYGFLTLKNGVPIGYVLVSSLFGSAEIAYNVFDTFRGAEAAPVFGRVMAMAHHVFGATAFSIDSYQLGYGNPEGLESGAWWFYYKMGFRPYDAEVKRVLRSELARMKRNPKHRSDLDTLERLASVHLFYYTGRPRREVLGRIPLGRVGLRISDYLARRFGSDRETGIRTCAKEVAARLGVRSLRSFSPGERLAWDRWSPLVRVLDGVERWTPAEKRDLVQVMRAKGGPRESDFVARFDAHSRLGEAVLRLMR